VCFSCLFGVRPVVGKAFECLKKEEKDDDVSLTCRGRRRRRARTKKDETNETA
jgi:hypothetical protein